MVFTFLFAIPLILSGIVYYFLKEISWKEFSVQVGVQALVAALSAFIVYHSNTVDTEVWNGFVARKEREQVSCSHSYRCHCHDVCSGSGSKKSCSEQCDTCYDHPYDVNWNVYTSNEEAIQIARQDSQGTMQPSRWTSIQEGDPTTVEHTYTNYLKGSPDTLFRHQGLVEKYKDRLPAYPKVFDYYRIRRFIPNNVPVSDDADWNASLDKLNANLGKAKQANIMVTLTTEPIDYFSALEESWLGGKKNDVVLVIGVGADHTLKWASVMAWTSNETFKVRLRNDVMSLGQLDREAVIEKLGDDVATLYKRKPMADFAYLQSSITPSTTQWILSLIVGVLCGAGLSYFFYKKDPFDRSGFNKPLRHHRRYGGGVGKVSF